MTYKYITSSNQSWFDLALQLLGDSSRAYELAYRNNCSILANPQPFFEIQYEIDNIFYINQTEFNNTTNSIIATLPNQVLFVNSFSNDFDLTEFI